MGRWGTEPGGAVMFRGLGQEGTPPRPCSQEGEASSLLLCSTPGAWDVLREL